MRDIIHLFLCPDDDEDGGGPQGGGGRAEAVLLEHHRQDRLQLLSGRPSSLQSTPTWTARKINYSCHDCAICLEVRPMVGPYGLFIYYFMASVFVSEV